MSLFKRKPDRDVIDRLRREQRRRRPAGTVFIVLGLALLAFHVGAEVWMSRKADEIANTLSNIQGSIPSQIPDRSASLRYATASLTYAIGFRSGLLFSQGMFFGAILLSQGIRLRFGGRKDRMLIHYFDLSNGEKVSPEPLRPS
jgi:hypothetical protein